MMLSVWKFPSAIRRPTSSSVSIFCVRNPCSRCSCSRLPVISRASRSLSTTLNVSPAAGAPLSPRISAGSAGLISLMRWLRSLKIAFTFPHCVPATTMSPTFRVPFCTSTVATYPRPLSSVDSITEPVALRFGLALRSRSSASRSTFSMSSSTPIPFFAEISCDWYFPPQSSTSMLRFASSSLMRFGSAVGLSHLLNANTMGTPAAIAWLIASFVCGITLSSAAMMMITISVIFAPRARMAVKAS